MIWPQLVDIDGEGWLWVRCSRGKLALTVKACCACAAAAEGWRCSESWVRVRCSRGVLALTVKVGCEWDAAVGVDLNSES